MAFPILLSGNTLGQRQQELNVRVRQAATENVPFEQIKDEAEQTDVDRLFKIDLASKYKHVEYIIDVLKCGDSLYISRALRSVWLYDEEFSNIINPDYLHHNLFPSMSSRMQRKFLTAISMHVRDEKRNEIFYHYCVTWRLPAIAKKFILFTSVQFKKHMIDNELDSLQRLLKQSEIIKNFIGENISLAECYLDKQTCSGILYLLRPFYFIDPQRYLHWTEQYYKYGTCYKQLGTRISKDIVTKHKRRVINNIKLYVELLKRSTLVKYTAIEDAKQYLIRLLPEDDRVFWNREFYSEYNFLIDIIPKEDQYNFMETIFIEKYSGRPFEMADEFLRQKYHLLMSTERREAWAMHHIALDKETSARDRNYFWFKFVNFDMALEAIKSYVLITPEDHKRAKVLKILVESTRSLSDVEKLLNYYYQRHVNEPMILKAEFMRKVIERHNIFEFNDNCWQVFQKLLHSLEVYNPDDSLYNNFDLKVTVLIYHIVNNLEIPVSLKKVLDYGTRWPAGYHVEAYAVKLNEENKKILYQFLFDLHVNQVKELENKDNEQELAQRLSQIRTLQTHLKIDNDSLPAIVLKLIKLKVPEKVIKEVKKVKTINQVELIRILKTNAAQVSEERSNLRYSIPFDFKYNIFLKKLRIYFTNDIAHEFLQFFTECLSAKGESRLILCSVYGIFQIADVKYKNEFIEKYIPVNLKIDHSQIDRDYLYIQEGICRYAGYSRPPVPLRTIRKYIAGDYLQHCEPMFGMYMANLRPPEKLQFVESLLDSPVSIQKHALRLAFECFNTEDLKSLIKRVWRKHKNISLRMVIYTYLFREVVRRKDASRDELFKYLLELMSDLNEDDHVDVLNLLGHYDHVTLLQCRRTRRGRRSRYRNKFRKPLNLPEEYKVVYIETAWKTVSKFPIKMRNAKLKVAVLAKIDQNVKKIDKAILRAIVDDFFDIMFSKNGIEYKNMVGGDDRGVIEAKGSLVFSFIKAYPNNADSVELVKSVLHNCFEKWNEVKKMSNPESNFYFIRDYCYRFISDLIDKCYPVRGKAVAINEILVCILSELQNFLPIHEIVMIVWKLRLLIMTSKLIEEAKELDEENNPAAFESVIIKFAQQVCALVKEFITKKMWYTSSLRDICVELQKNIERINSATSFHFNSYNIRIVFALNLLDYGTHETDLLAAYLIPDIGSGGSRDKLSMLTQKLEACDHLEIKSIMYERFKQNGFKELI